MNIGELAQRSGVSTDTLRFYERVGLLDAPRRAPNGYRNYSEADVGRVAFVRRAQGIGFSLTEIASIVPRLASGALQRSELEARMLAKLGEIDAQMKQLRALRRELQQALTDSTCSIAPAAPAPRARFGAGSAVSARRKAAVR